MSHFKNITSLLFISIICVNGLADNTDHVIDVSCKSVLTLDEFTALAMNQNLEIAEIDNEYANSLAKAFEAKVLANPELSVEQVYTKQELAGANDSQSNVSIGQPLKFSDFGSKKRVGDLIRKVGDVNKKASLLEFRQKLIIKFYKLFMLQEINKIISKSEKDSAEKISMIKKGLSNGLFSTGEEKLLEGQQYSLQAQKKGIAANIYALQQDLTKSLNIKCLVVAEGFQKLDSIIDEESLIKKANESGFSEVTRIELLDKLALESQKLARLDAYQITPKLLYQHTNDGGDFVGAGISIPLPLWNRNQGQRLRANAEVNVMEQKKLLFADGGLARQIKYLKAAAENSREQAEIYTTKVVPSFQSGLQAQEKLYSNGKGNIIEIWQTIRALNEAQIQGLTFWMETMSARVELSLLIGEEI